MKEPKLKYDFHNGEKIKKVKKKGYRYCGKGEIGELKHEMIDGKKYFYVEDSFGRSNFSKHKRRFKEVEYWEEDIEWKSKWVEKKKPKEILIFNTRIEMPKERMLSSYEVKLGKRDQITFFDINESNIVKDLQLIDGDKLKITIVKTSHKDDKTNQKEVSK